MTLGEKNNRRPDYQTKEETEVQGIVNDSYSNRYQWDNGPKQRLENLIGIHPFFLLFRLVY